MNRYFLTSTALLSLLFLIEPSQSQNFEIDDVHVFMKADDFFQNKYLQADKTSNVKYFRKDKANVAEKKEAWGFANAPVGNSDFRPVYRSYFTGQQDYILVEALGTICLYATGMFGLDKNGKGAISYNTVEPYLISVGLDGPIMKANRKNLEEVMDNDQQALQKIESTIKNVSGNAQQYLVSREEVVRFYNERHPSGKLEFDLTAPDKPHKKKN
jgi:hypothetical protein